MKRSFYAEIDPFCDSRAADDSQYTLDHFYQKLFNLVESLKTEAGRIEGEKRLKVMKKYLLDFESEIKISLPHQKGPICEKSKFEAE